MLCQDVRTDGDNSSNKVCFFLKRESFEEKIMVVGVMSGLGPLPLIKVPPKVKVNSEYYIRHVLKPLLEVQIPNMNGTGTNKVTVHNDQASSHTSKLTMAYAAQVESTIGIKILPKKHIPVKSTDISPLDFYGFGYLKQRLLRRRAKTLDGVWKVLKQGWSRITPDTSRIVFVNKKDAYD